MAALTFDTAQNAGTPPSGKYADLETKVEQLAAVVNDHATGIDANTAGVAAVVASIADDDGALADSAVSPALITSVPRRTASIQHANAATETLVYKTAVKIEIIGLEILKEGADAGGTVQMTTAGDVAISDAIAAATDKAKTSAGTLDPATRTLAAGATFKLVFTRGSGTSKSEVLFSYVQRT